MIKLKNIIDTDILVVGGGIGGLCAAIAAAENGAKTLILEKANTRRSGSGATGNDHFVCYYPKFHGNDIRPIIKEIMESMNGPWHDTLLTKKFFLRSMEIVEKWHSWGINMKPFGNDYAFMGHAFPGRPRIFLKYDGHNQKHVLTQQALKAGASILNHHPVLDLLRNKEGITGALALDMTEPEPSYIIVRAQKVILATGSATRLYPPAGTPGWIFNTAFCPSCTGAAQAQGWRIGATLVNMELPNRHAGPKFFSRAGKNTWIGIYRYPDGKQLAPFVSRATREVGDITCDAWNSAYTDLMVNGTGPAYIDCTDTSPEDFEFMKAGFYSEGLSALVDYMSRESIDPAKHCIEFMQYEPHLIGRGLQINTDAQTSIPGLYAAGDMVGNYRSDISGAAVWGWIAGEHASKHLQGHDVDDAERSDWAQERMEFYQLFYQRQKGASWKEAHLALEQLMDNYAAAGPHRTRSETLLKAGLSYMDQLRTCAVRDVSVRNSHELLRFSETLDLMDNGTIIMHAARERKETRAMHIRSDYTFTNPLLNDKFLTIRQEAGQPVLAWRLRWEA